MAHVPGGDELAFLDVDGAPGFAGCDEQVSLAAEERRNLEHIDSFSGDFAVGRLVNVGQDGKACVFGDLAEDAHAFFEAGGRGSS